MTFGLIARCDGGGLATITQELHRHLAPVRTLLLDLGERGRGDCTDGDYQHGDVFRTEWGGGLAETAIDWICAPGPDVLFSAEILYDDRILTRARQNGQRVFVYAMPELAPWATTAFDRSARSAPRPELLIPTGWRANTLPDARWLPWPVATDRLPHRQRDEVAHLYHVTGTAMRDRNGTNLLLAALPSITERCRLTIRSERPIDLLDGIRNVDVHVERGRAANYWDTIPTDADLLVQTRRYGGLSLPVQECAALGIPTLALATDLYADLPFVHALSPTKPEQVRMKGGLVDVWTADPRALAAAIGHLIRHPDQNARASAAAGAWAREHAWNGPLGARWCETLEADCEEVAA